MFFPEVIKTYIDSQFLCCLFHLFPGGIWKAVGSCIEMGGSSFGLFLGSQRSWKRPVLDETAAAKFREQCSLRGFDPAHVLPHGSYLMNCGSPKEGVSCADGFLLQVLSLIPSCTQLTFIVLQWLFHLSNCLSSSDNIFLACVSCCTQMCLRRARPCWWMSSAAAASWVSTSTTFILAPPWVPSPQSSVWTR